MRTSRAGAAARHFPLLLLAAGALFPAWFLTVTALKTREDYLVNKFGPPAAVTLDNLGRVLGSGTFPRWFGNSLVLTAGAVLLCSLLAALAAYAFARLHFRGKALLYHIVLSLMVVPPVVIVVPLFTFMVKAKLVNTLSGVILIYTGLVLPFSIFLLTSFFRSISGAVLEAAEIDGCTPLQVLFRIMVPLAAPAFITLTVVNAAWVWNELLISVIFLQKDSLKTLMVGLTVFRSRYTLDIPLTMAGLLVATLPMALLYLVGQRYFIQGLTAGSTKG